MASIPDGKPLTGKPDAGDPPVRFGGRGKVNPLSLPLYIRHRSAVKLHQKPQATANDANDAKRNPIRIRIRVIRG